MKTLILCILFLVAGYAIAERSQRMQFQGYEKVKDQSDIVLFEYFHDTETKQEVICVFGGVNVASCYITGRIW